MHANALKKTLATLGMHFNTFLVKNTTVWAKHIRKDEIFYSCIRVAAPPPPQKKCHLGGHRVCCKTIGVLKKGSFLM
jgi:hypothetical protein